jgi:hypothetical protein
MILAGRNQRRNPCEVRSSLSQFPLRRTSLLPTGSLLREIRFVARLNKKTEGTIIGVDGLLPVGLFRRVFISYADRYVVLNPR